MYFLFTLLGINVSFAYSPNCINTGYRGYPQMQRISLSTLTMRSKGCASSIDRSLFV